MVLKESVGGYSSMASFVDDVAVFLEDNLDEFEAYVADMNATVDFDEDEDEDEDKEEEEEEEEEV